MALNRLLGPLVRAQGPVVNCSGCEARHPPGAFFPFCPGFASKGTVELLLGEWRGLGGLGAWWCRSRRGCRTAITSADCSQAHTERVVCRSLAVAAVDTWDRLREGAFRALLRLPTPLPGLEGGRRVEGLLGRALTLVSSPRLGESDAGAWVSCGKLPCSF